MTQVTAHIRYQREDNFDFWIISSGSRTEKYYKINIACKYIYKIRSTMALHRQHAKLYRASSENDQHP